MFINFISIEQNMHMTGCMSFPLCSESHRRGACSADTDVHVYTDGKRYICLERN